MSLVDGQALDTAAPGTAAPETAALELLRRLEIRFGEARLRRAAGTTGARAWTGLAFRLAGRGFVVPRTDVREVVSPPLVTRVPGSRAWLLGLANVRGGLLGIVDLAQALGLNPVPAAPAAGQGGRGARVLIYGAERLPVGFLVDDVAGFATFTPHEQVTVPVNDDLGSVRIGAFARGAETWDVVSLGRVLARAEPTLALAVGGSV